VRNPHFGVSVVSDARPDPDSDDPSPDVTASAAPTATQVAGGGTITWRPL